MDIVLKTKNEAAKRFKTIVLPEGEDPRILDAAAEIVQGKLAKLILIGDVTTIEQELAKRGVTQGDYTLINHTDDPAFGRYVQIYHELRQKKGISMDEARKDMEHPVFYAAMLVREGLADGCVAGAVNTTALVLQAGLRIIGVKRGLKTISSSFIMLNKDGQTGPSLFMFGDCAVNPEPTAEMLADIAISTAESCRIFLHREPYVAMLSFSTKGSGDAPSSQKVREATELIRKRRPELNVDGEMQLDAAIMPDVAARKAPGSSVAGKANVFIFPNLDAGNIGYKLVERFAGMTAIGPVVQGFAKPINDLSRGVKYPDIVTMVAVTALQSESDI